MARRSASAAQLIEGLSFVKVVDTMLLENTPAVDVARWIQEDQGQLIELNTKTLVNALLQRKAELRDRVDVPKDPGRAPWVGDAGADEEDPGEEEPSSGGWLGSVYGVETQRPVKTPTTLSRELMARTEGGIEEIIEMEALYLAQRERIGRLMEIEHRAGAPWERLGAEFQIAAEMLMKRVTIKEKLGLVGGDSSFRMILDVKGYSQETASTLQQPESRRRVVSLLERMARMGKLTPELISRLASQGVVVDAQLVKGEDDDDGEEGGGQAAG